MRLRRFAALVGAAVICGVMLVAASGASAAPGPQLRVVVGPAAVHPHQAYTITITGSYGLVASGAPYMLAFIQYSPAACKGTATAEYRLPGREWDWAFGQVHQQEEVLSPFKAVAYWTSGVRLGGRQVCAYLYATKISPQSTADPIASASAYFRNVKRS
jgi:hypothetical protein